MIEVKNLVKEFEYKQVLKGISTVFKSATTNLIIGKSGAGKTVLLKSLIGLVTPTSGEILFDGEGILQFDKEKRKQLYRKMGVMFQGSALFDSMTVLENVQFPLDMFLRKPLKTRRSIAQEYLKKVGLADAAAKYPSEISGGMMKRAAIARALVTRPKYLFCDEPNSGLDPKTGGQIDQLIHDLTKEFEVTTIINTHDMNSVHNIGENIIFLYRGEKNWEGSASDIEKTGTPELKRFIL